MQGRNEATILLGRGASSLEGRPVASRGWFAGDFGRQGSPSDDEELLALQARGGCSQHARCVARPHRMWRDGPDWHDGAHI